MPNEQSGVASGINDTFRQVGVATGVAALVAAARQGFLDGFNVVLVIGAVLAFAGALLAVALVHERDLVAQPDGLFPPGPGAAVTPTDPERAVVFLLGRRPPKDGGREQLVPIGSAFLAATGQRTYVVTAKHLLAHEAETFLQVSGTDGATTPLAVDGWSAHPQADVAVAPVTLETWMDHGAVSLDGDRARAAAGQPVVFMSLLADVPELTARSVVMTRGGAIGALDQDAVPVAQRGGETLRVRAHLVACGSFAGVAGAPCFVRDGTRTTLLGVMAGHFDKWTKLQGDGDFSGDFVGSAETPVNSSVGVCTPVAEIRAAVRLRGYAGSVVQ